MKMFKKYVIWMLFVVLMIGLSFTALSEQNVCLAAPNTLEELASGLAGKGIKPDGTPLRVGFCIPELWSEFIVSFNYSSWLLGQAGCIVTIVNADNDVTKQKNFFDDFVTMGCDVILSISVDPNAIAPTVQEIKEKYGIPFIFMNKGVYDKNGTSLADYYIGSPDYEMGRKAAEFIVKKAAGRQVKIAEITGPLYQFTALNRHQGFMDVVKQNSNIEVVSSRDCEWLADKAMNATSDILTVHNDIFAIFSQSDCMLPGVFSALQQAKQLYPVGDSNHIIVIATDGAPYAFQEIRNGYLDMTLEHSPYGMSTVGVKAVLSFAQGLPFPKEKDVTIVPVEVTAENVDDTSLWGNYGTPKNELWPETLRIWKEYPFPEEESFWQR